MAHLQTYLRTNQGADLRHSGEAVRGKTARRVILADPLQVPQQSPAASRAHASAVVYLIVYPSSANGPRINGQNHPKCLIELARPNIFELLTPKFVG